MSQPAKPARFLIAVLLLTLLLIGTALLAATVGHYPLSVRTIWEVVLNPASHPQDAQVFYQVRLVRIVCAALIGAALALAGSVFQAVFSNPMVSPDVLGASAGAGLGATLALMVGAGGLALQAFSFMGGVFAVVLALLVAKFAGSARGSLLTLVLTGMVVASLANAVIALIKYVADPENKLPQITFWLLGGLSTVRPSDMWVLLAVVPVCTLVLLALGWRLTVISFGEDQAESVGVNAQVVRTVAIAAATLLTAVSVSVAGIVGWVGLIIPHVARILVGSDNRRVLPTAALAGAVFVLAVDTITRLVPSAEVPLGVLTALVGAPVFLWLLIYGRRRGWT